MNVKVIAEMQNKKEKNHRMCLKSGSLYHFSASKGMHLEWRMCWNIQVAAAERYFLQFGERSRVYDQSLNVEGML
jgi:hypothetical protein